MAGSQAGLSDSRLPKESGISIVLRLLARPACVPRTTTDFFGLFFRAWRPRDTLSYAAHTANPANPAREASHALGEKEGLYIICPSTLLEDREPAAPTLHAAVSVFSLPAQCQTQMLLT